MVGRGEGGTGEKAGKGEGERRGEGGGGAVQEKRVNMVLNVHRDHK